MPLPFHCSSFSRGKNIVSPTPAAISGLLLYLLLLSNNTGLATCHGHKAISHYSCGNNTISYPFRLRGDPSECGDPNYELLCEGNNTVLYLPSAKYYVTEIIYDSKTIHLVDVDLASGNCSLPYSSSSLRGLLNGNRFQLVEEIWASFMNCSRKIHDQTYIYTPLPCLSGNGTIVYVTGGSFTGLIDHLHPFCHFIAMVPANRIFISNPHQDVFQFLQEGFHLSWANNCPSQAEIVDICLREATRLINEVIQSKIVLEKILSPFSFQSQFLYCLRVNNVDPFQSNYWLAVVRTGYIAQVLLVLHILGRFIFAPLSILVFLAYKFWGVRAPIDTLEKFLQNQDTLSPARYSFPEIIIMTSNFREKLGQGGFGSVFKGNLPGGHLVAVKMLGNSKCNGEEFINEVSTIGRIHHVNIVQLVGFCSEGVNRALIYEFMANGSLDKYIFSSNGTNRHFTMEKLNEIALSVARGIDYLHRGCDMRILHFDIKPHNILLDHDFTPKVSDFGLAKLYPKDNSLVSVSAARGTIGYIAPELVSRSFGVISYKSDVYSFGMLLMEMAGGRRNVDPRVENSSQIYYPSWIYDRLQQSEGLEICDAIEIDDMERKLCKVGLWCIQMRPSDRPSMSRVIEMLVAEVDTLQMPPNPFLSTSRPISIRQPSMDSSLTELSIICETE